MLKKIIKYLLGDPAIITTDDAPAWVSYTTVTDVYPWAETNKYNSTTLYAKCGSFYAFSGCGNYGWGYSTLREAFYLANRYEPPECGAD